MDNEFSLAVTKVCLKLKQIAEKGSYLTDEDRLFFHKEGVSVKFKKPISDRHCLVSLYFTTDHYSEGKDITMILSVLQMGNNAVALFMPYDMDKETALTKEFLCIKEFGLNI